MQARQSFTHKFLKFNNNIASYYAGIYFFLLLIFKDSLIFSSPHVAISFLKYFDSQCL